MPGWFHSDAVFKVHQLQQTIKSIKNNLSVCTPAIDLLQYIVLYINKPYSYLWLVLTKPSFDAQSFIESFGDFKQSLCSNFQAKFALIIHLLYIGFFSQTKLQYRPVTTAHTRVIFHVVPLIFIAWVKSKSMHGLGPRPLMVLGAVTSMFMHE